MPSIRETALGAVRPLTYLLPKRIGRPLRRELRDRLALAHADAVVVSFPKSGRTWTRILLSRLYRAHYNFASDDILEFDNLHQLDPRIPKILFTHDGEPWHTPETLKRDKCAYNRKKLVVLVRNPIDVAVSRYFHIRNRARWVPHPAYREMSLADFVWAPLGGLPTIVAYMNIWHHACNIRDDFYIVRYEDLRFQGRDALGAVAAFLGVNATCSELDDAITYASFERLQAEEKRGALSSHRLGARHEGNDNSLKVRRGKVHGYLDYFSPAEITRMENFVQHTLEPSYGYGRASITVAGAPTANAQHRARLLPVASSA